MSMPKDISGEPEIWCPELWVDIDFDIDTNIRYYNPSKAKSFYDPQDLEDGYLIRGVSPVYHKVEDPRRDFY